MLVDSEIRNGELKDQDSQLIVALDKETETTKKIAKKKKTRN